jgi:hypothetical protein
MEEYSLRMLVKSFSTASRTPVPCSRRRRSSSGLQGQPAQLPSTHPAAWCVGALCPGRGGWSRLMRVLPHPLHGSHQNMGCSKRPSSGQSAKYGFQGESGA